MSDRKFTLFELHLDGDLNFASSLGDESDEQTEETAESAGSGAGKKLLGVLAVVALVLALRRLLGSGELPEIEAEVGGEQ